jgi:hypothetical protein
MLTLREAEWKYIGILQIILEDFLIKAYFRIKIILK